MKIILDKNKLSKLINNERNLGFVPTMGAIHAGHLSLISRSNELCKKTIVSIFVNKPQFNNKEDFKKYPKFLKKDIKKLKKLKVDYLYMPKAKEVYPNGHNINIKISSFKNKLCGQFRPGHFEAVVDVVNNFVKIIKPKKVFFGEKDMQQLVIIKRFFKNRYKNLKIINCKTIREKDGLALSSRNLNLTSKQRLIGSSIYDFILKNKLFFNNGKKTHLKYIKKKIIKLGANKIDYIELLNVKKLLDENSNKKEYRLFIAYYLGNVRLIDNI